MAQKIYSGEKFMTPEGVVVGNVECYSNHKGKAVFAAYGDTEEEQRRLTAYRVEVCDQMRDKFQEDTGRDVQEVRFFVPANEGIDLLGIKVEYGPDGKTGWITADYAERMTVVEFTKIGESLDHEDFQNQHDLAAHRFPVRPGPDR